VLSSEEEYVRAAERFAALVGMTEEEGARDKAEAELDEMNVWKDYGEVRPSCCSRLPQYLRPQLM
jgi:hypothetical protein